ncbi:hypothetical protein Vlu01_32760 [Micromonospora lutea]|uniref:DNA-binding protein n=1 Tax=Micromonospora lutea TaxID=419825 RepID=A0ABQ4IXQ3_9ACTN|nr:hypothetical protein Vlu01_32760 [Micromonospora lutea]
MASKSIPARYTERPTRSGPYSCRSSIRAVGQGQVAVHARHVQSGEPIAELMQGKVWRKSDVEAWIREHRPELAGD